MGTLERSDADDSDHELKTANVAGRLVPPLGRPSHLHHYWKGYGDIECREGTAHER